MQDLELGQVVYPDYNAAKRMDERIVDEPIRVEAMSSDWIVFRTENYGVVFVAFDSDKDKCLFLEMLQPSKPDYERYY